MDTSDITRLDSCIEIARLLSHCEKVVEDDTCLERIVTAIGQILKRLSVSYGVTQQITGTHSIFEEPCRNIIANSKAYPYSSVTFLLKIRALFIMYVHDVSSPDWKERLKVLVTFPSLVRDWGKKLSPSLQNAWLDTIFILIGDSVVLQEVVPNLNLNHIVSSVSSPSIFVRKQAYKCIAELTVNLQKIVNTMDDMSERISISSTIICIGETISEECDLQDYMEICSKLLDTNHSSAMKILISWQFPEYVDSHNISILSACKSGEWWITHFMESLFNSSTTQCPVSEKLIPDDILVNFGLVVLMNHPTKSMGWTMLTSVMMHSPGLWKEVESICEDVILLPLRLLSHENYISKGCDRRLQEWFVALKELVTNRSKMSSILCFCFQSLSKLWEVKKNKWNHLLNELLEVLNAITGRSTGCFPVATACLEGNGKIAVALLNVINMNFDNLCDSIKVTLYDSLLLLLRGQNYDHDVVQACNGLILKITNDFHGSKFLEKVLVSLQKQLLDRRWEVRDSALEFLMELVCIDNIKVSNCDFANVLKQQTIHTSVVQLVKDRHSYVRASALKLLMILISNTDIFCEEIETSILPLVMSVLLKDREAMSRRSAVFLLLACLKKNDILVKNVISSLQKLEKATNESSENSSHNVERNDTGLPLNVSYTIEEILFQDLDWEVKWNAIDIVEYLLYFSSSENTNLDLPKSERGTVFLGRVLEKMILDCDKAVRDKAKSIFTKCISEGILDALLPVAPECNMDMLDLDNLLEEVLMSLRSEGQIRLSKGCHGPDNSDMDSDENSFILDCY